MASGAGRYNPVFYFLVGTRPSPSTECRPLRHASHGRRAVLPHPPGGDVARSRVRDRSESGWLLFGRRRRDPIVALFSSAMVAPNGLELFRGLRSGWRLLALLRRNDDGPPPRSVLAAYRRWSPGPCCSVIGPYGQHLSCSLASSARCRSSARGPLGACGLAPSSHGDRGARRARARRRRLDPHEGALTIGLRTSTPTTGGRAGGPGPQGQHRLGIPERSPRSLRGSTLGPPAGLRGRACPAPGDAGSHGARGETRGPSGDLDGRRARAWWCPPSSPTAPMPTTASRGRGATASRLRSESSSLLPSRWQVRAPIRPDLALVGMASSSLVQALGPDNDGPRAAAQPRCRRTAHGFSSRSWLVALLVGIASALLWATDEAGS